MDDFATGYIAGQGDNNNSSNGMWGGWRLDFWHHHSGYGFGWGPRRLRWFRRWRCQHRSRPPKA